MGTKSQKHTHQYYKVRQGFGVGPLKGRAQWACGLPDCTHFLPGNMPEPIGKLSICNECMEEFILDVENMKRDKPICEKCANPDALRLPDDIDWERMEARSFVAKNENKPLEEVTEEEINRMVQRRRLIK